MKRERQLKRIGWIPVAALGLLVGLLIIFALRGPVVEPLYLAFVLHVLFVLFISILLSIISARAYLLSGSLNILLLGIASLVAGVLLIISKWAVTPSLGSTLSSNEAMTIGSIGIIPRFISAVTQRDPTVDRKRNHLAHHIAKGHIWSVISYRSLPDRCGCSDEHRRTIPPPFHQ